MVTELFTLKFCALLAHIALLAWTTARSVSGAGGTCPGNVTAFSPSMDFYLDAVWAEKIGLPREKLYLIKKGSAVESEREKLSKESVIPASMDVVQFKLVMPEKIYSCSGSSSSSENKDIASAPTLGHITVLPINTQDKPFGTPVSISFKCRAAGKVRLHVNLSCRTYHQNTPAVKKKHESNLPICFTKICSGGTNPEDETATNGGSDGGPTVLYAAVTVGTIAIAIIFMVVYILHKSKKTERVPIRNAKTRLTGDGHSATEYSQSQLDSRSQSDLPGDSRYSVTGSTVLPSIDDSKTIQLTNGQPSSTSTDSGTCISVSMTSGGWQNHSPFKDFNLSGFIELGQLLQKGSYSQVLEGVWKQTNENSLPVLIKTTGSKATPSEVHSCASKAVLMRYCPHRHIRKVYGIFFPSNAAPLMVFPYFTGQVNLKVLLTRARARLFADHIVDDSVSENSVPSTLSTSDLIRLGYQLARACNKLSRSGSIVHKDIAARNCIVLPDLELKLCDSALSSDLFSDEYHYHNKLGDRKGPLKWMAIECIEEGFFSTCSDVWAFGVTLWEILTLGRMPYEDVDEHLMESHLRAGKRLEKPQRCSEELFKTIGCCWAMSPQDRPHFSTIKQNLYMQLDQMRSYSSPC